MPLRIVRDDIVKMQVDAIVTAVSAVPGTPKPTGGVNGRIHQKAGARLLEALRRMGGVRTAGATLTPGYDLPCKYVIHTAGPIWRGGSYGEEMLLRACYLEVLKLAAREGLESVAFPLISAGTYGYPKAEAMRVAAETIGRFLEDHEMTVYLVVYDRETFRVSNELFADVEQFIDQHYVDRHYVARNIRDEDWYREDWETSILEEAVAPAGLDDDADPFIGHPLPSAAKQPSPAPAPAKKPKKAAKRISAAKEMNAARPRDAEELQSDMAAAPEELLRMLRQLDAGFAPYLLQLIDRSGMKDSECYKRANIDRKLFSKIRSNPAYKPSKPTAVAFCVALELTLPQTQELLSRAGFTLSRANKFDVIVEYFIVRGRYDVHEINQVLFAYDMPLLGA